MVFSPRKWRSAGGEAKLRRWIVLAIALAAGALGYALVSRPETAPAVAFPTLRGESLALNALRGKVVLIEFWATDCATCVKEMPQLVKTYERYRGRGFEAIAVAMRYDPPNHVIAYTERNRLPFPVAFDPTGEIAKAFSGVKFTPTTFLVDKRGRIVARLIGERDFARLDALIEEILEEPA
jgi:peroxiredoxin